MHACVCMFVCVSACVLVCVCFSVPLRVTWHVHPHLYIYTSTCTLHRVRGLRVWLFSITLPCRQLHTVFRGCVHVCAYVHACMHVCACMLLCMEAPGTCCCISHTMHVVSLEPVMRWRPQWSRDRQVMMSEIIINNNNVEILSKSLSLLYSPVHVQSALF